MLVTGDRESLLGSVDNSLIQDENNDQAKSNKKSKRSKKGCCQNWKQMMCKTSIISQKELYERYTNTKCPVVQMIANNGGGENKPAFNKISESTQLS